MTITGIALDPVLSVGTIRFEPAANCTETVAGATVGTIVATGARSSDATLNRLMVAVGGAGLAAERYAVCVQFLSSNTTVGGFVQVGNTRLLASSVSAFTPLTRLEGVASERVTIAGIALDPMVSVRSVRFEPGVVCTPATAGAANGTVVATGGLVDLSGGALTSLEVTIGGSGLVANIYSVCIDYVANVASGAFEKVGGGELYIGELVSAERGGVVLDCSFTHSTLFACSGRVVSFLPASVQRLTSGEVVTVSGVALDPVISVRSVRFEPGAWCTTTISGATNGTVTASGAIQALASNTKLTVVVGGSGLPPALYAVCVDFHANIAQGNYQMVGSVQLYVGECAVGRLCFFC